MGGRTAPVQNCWSPGRKRNRAGPYPHTCLRLYEAILIRLDRERSRDAARYCYRWEVQVAAGIGGISGVPGSLFVTATG